MISGRGLRLANKGLVLGHGDTSIRQRGRRAPGAGLAGRFSFKTWDNGDLMVHEAVLPYLTREGISFRVQGQETYEHFRPSIRDSAAASV